MGRAQKDHLLIPVHDLNLLVTTSYTISAARAESTRPARTRLRSTQGTWRRLHERSGRERPSSARRTPSALPSSSGRRTSSRRRYHMEVQQRKTLHPMLLRGRRIAWSCQAGRTLRPRTRTAGRCTSAASNPAHPARHIRPRRNGRSQLCGWSCHDVAGLSGVVHRGRGEGPLFAEAGRVLGLDRRWHERVGVESLGARGWRLRALIHSGLSCDNVAVHQCDSSAPISRHTCLRLPRDPAMQAGGSGGLPN